MKFFENYLKIRKDLVKEALEKTNYNKKEFYSKIKLKYLTLSLSSLIIQFSLKRNIQPNSITFTYIFLLLLSFIFIISQNNFLIFSGLLIIFLNNCLDFADGHLARKVGKTSIKGHILDVWSGYLKVIIFQITLFIFLFNVTTNIYFLFFAIIFLLLKSADIKFFAKANIDQKENQKKNDINEIKKKYFFKNSFLPKILKNFIKIIYYDGRSKYTDFVLLVYLISIITQNYVLLEIISIIWIVLNTISFFLKLTEVLKMNVDLKK